MKRFDWKSELFNVLIAVLVISIIEAFLQKGPFDYGEIILSTLWVILAILLIRVIIAVLRKEY